MPPPRIFGLEPPCLSHNFMTSIIFKKGAYGSSWDESHHRATGRHLLHGITQITQCYLPPNTSEPALTPASKLVLDLPTAEGWKAELTYSYPAMHRPGVELAISRSQVRRPNHYTTEPLMSNNDAKYDKVISEDHMPAMMPHSYCIVIFNCAMLFYC